MKKTVSLFQRNYDTDRRVRDEIVPGAEWVSAGEGVATQKFDGTSCLVRGGRFYKRHDAKKGKTPPAGFEAAQDPDPATGHWPGWLPVGDGPEDRWHWEAWNAAATPLTDGTYELCGPKIQGNPEGLASHQLLRHGAVEFPDAPRTFAALKEWLESHDVEGIVWHHPDGRMVKIKARDFGLKRRTNVQKT
jgi:hypothetical protein